VFRNGDRLSERTPPEPRPRDSVAGRWALGSVLLIVGVTAWSVAGLSQRDWERQLESKRAAADMVASLLAGTITAPLASRDAGALTTALERLRSNAMIVYAAVYAADGANPLAEYHNGHADGGATSERDAGELQVQSGVHAANGARLGSVVLRVSLAQEVRVHRHTQARLIGFGAGIAVALALLSIAMMRRVLVAPLRRLEDAAGELARGARSTVPTERDDELGGLSRCFNALASSLDERSRRIASQNRRLQALFENMSEAILVFGSDRLLTEERSRSAERWLEARPGNSIVDTLYPEDESLESERRAFEAWLELAFSAPSDTLREVLERGPRQLQRSDGQRTMSFELSFRLAEQVGGARQLMLLATDVTEQRRLEALERERLEQRELPGMRRPSLELRERPRHAPRG
jgi:two-component system, chemotaxis family, sensor kinase CheA